MKSGNRKKIIITGATGFIGKQLVASLKDQYDIVIFTQNIENAKKILGNSITAVYCDQTSENDINSNVEGAYGIINLAGENIGSRRWTKKQKAKILDSRIRIGIILIEAIINADKKPEVFIQASAIGYYGYGFLADVTRQWEKSTDTINSGIRHIILRLGIVLGKDGGILKRILLPFKYFLGGYPGKGQQWISWIHINDVVDVISFILENSHLSGVYNLTAPNPVQNKYLIKVIGKIIKRPSWLSIPAIILILFFGQRAKELLLESTRIYPKRLLADGYKFSYSTIDKALKDLI